MRVTAFFLILLYLPGLRAQGNASINNSILHSSFDQSFAAKPAKRKLLSFTKKSAYYNPLNYLGAGLLYFYQNVVSEQIQADCAYETSCSQYTKLSIQQHGLIIGVLSGFNQWSECFKGALYEHPPVYRNNNNKIINYCEKETE